MSERDKVGAGELKGDCYSAGERGAMEWAQRVRGRLFGPMLRLMARLRITPDHLSAASLAAGLAFTPLWFWSKGAAFAFLGLHVLIDGLDGPLARHLGTASRKGSFTDSMADQAVIISTTLTLMMAGVMGKLVGGCYMVSYTVVVLFAMMRNYLEAPYSWLLRPRFYVYGWLIVETYWWAGTIDYLLWGCTAVLMSKVVTGFVRIRRKL